MLLPDLTNDVLHLIAEQLKCERDINAFARINHHLFDLLNPYLYRYNAQYSNSSALLWVAEQHGNSDDAMAMALVTVGLSLARGAIPDVANNKDETPLLLACKSGQKQVVKLLLTVDHVNPNRRAATGWSPLLWAAHHGDFATVSLLLAHPHIDPDLKRDNPSSVIPFRPLNLRYRPHFRGPDPQAATDQTPLSHAAMNGHADIVELLLHTSGVDPNSTDRRRGWTPLFYAAVRGHEDVVSQLLSAAPWIDPNQTSRSRTSLLHCVVATNPKKSMATLLLSIPGVDPNIASRWGNTPLATAAKNGDEDLVRLLLAHGSDPNSSNRQGQTPLSFAMKRGHQSMVSLLVEVSKHDRDCVYDDRNDGPIDTS